MQLKRDTDFALRLLLCAAEQGCKETNAIPLQTLSTRAKVPVTIAGRLCTKMADSGLLQYVCKPGGARGYLPAPDLCGKTLYDVICAIEGHDDLFAIFDKSTALFVNGIECFELTEQRFEDAMNLVTLRQLMKKSDFHDANA